MSSATDRHDEHAAHHSHDSGAGAGAPLSFATYRKMVQNLWWAAGYNIVALPLAASARGRRRRSLPRFRHPQRHSMIS